jgi:predicted nuclease of predicted toxin-antitoxin system
MVEKVRFHLDENVSNAVAEGLRRREIDVTTTPEEALIGVSDIVQLEFALAQKRVIFSQDVDFLRLHQTGITHAEIIYCLHGNKSMGEIIRGLILIWELLETNDMLGKVEFL